MKNMQKCQDCTLFVLRLIIASIFLYAAYAKLGLWSGTPEGMSAGMVNFMKFISVAELLGGIALVIGYLTKWAALGLSIIMVGAIFVLQFSMQVGFSTATGPGWNFPLMILGGCLVLCSYGAGRYAIDAKRKK